jgi:hypothetical protein
MISSPYSPLPHHRQDPNHWDVVLIDQALPMDPTAKACLVKDKQTWSRIYLLPIIQLISNILLFIVLVIKHVIPVQFHFYGSMHQLASWFLKTWVTPEGAYFVLRHINIGSNIINFLIDNGPDINIEKSNLYPENIDALTKDFMFMKHDFNLYNFIYDYHQAEKVNPNWIQEVHQRGIQFDSIISPSIEVDFSQRKWSQFLDMQSTVELFKVIYCFCLTRHEFERAVVSLQFDESFGLYFSKIMNDYRWNHVVTNRHPLISNSPFASGRNVFLHAIVTEYLHQYLELEKMRSTQELGPIPVDLEITPDPLSA